MATFTSDIVANKDTKPVAFPYETGTPITQRSVVALPNTHAASDIIKLNILPAGCSLVDYKVASDVLDTNGSPTFRYTVGVLNAAGTDLVASTEIILTAPAATIGVQQMNHTNGLKNIGVGASDQIIAAKVTTVAATKAAGSMFGIMTYKAAEYGA